MRTIAFAALGLGLSLPCARPCAAQGPRGADTLSAAAVAESLTVIHTLDTQLRSNPRDAAGWYHRAMVAWAMLDRSISPNAPAGLDANNFGYMIDSSLHMAVQMAPSSAMYHLMLGRFQLTRGNISVRSLSNGNFGKALDFARKGTDSALISEAAVEVGRIAWRKFDSFKNRRMQSSEMPMERSISDALHPSAKAIGELTALSGADPSFNANPEMYDATPANSIKDVEALIRSSTTALPTEVNGALDYEHATALFREAYTAFPNNPRAFRSMAMLLADSSRWKELELFSRGQIARVPWDPNAWLALGLARHREGDSKSAQAAFDSAFVYLDPGERARLDRIERVLKPNDARLAHVSVATRDATSNLYWKFADPLWSRDGNETRAEFLARVVFAELRWSVDELNLRGADTDRGDIYIRYGPPDLAAAIMPKASSDGNDIITYWVYRSGLLFSFSGMPSYGSARTPIWDKAMAEATKDLMPVRWDNINHNDVDTIPVQVARFRGGADSVDVLVATTPPYDRIVAGSDVRETVRDEYWLLLGGRVAVYHDSTVLAGAGGRAWTRRVAPGEYVYRTEATASGSTRAGRATASVLADVDARTGFSPRGFGVSDPLVAAEVQPGTDVKRWSDLHATPQVGAVKHGSQFELVWENYDFGAADGAAKYTVSVSIVRDRSAAGRIAASVIGALASVAQIDRQSDREVIRFDRAVPHAAAIVDHVQIALGETPVGRYTVTIEVADAVSARKATRTIGLVVKP